MSGPPASFGTTISSGIQDVSAILSLFGTEECELHVGSALRGGGRGGYLYAAITPVSIFGSLGPAKAAFSIMCISLRFIGARTLQHMGFEAKGDAVAITMPDGDRYVAETRLLELLNKHYVRSALDVSVERPPYQPIQLPIRPWNFKLLIASLLVACLGVTPYIHFSVLQHTSFPALAIFFPFCRVIGGLLCVFPGQLLLQYRIEMILKQRILFKGINDLLNDQNMKIPTQYIRLWNESYASEMCLSSLNNFLKTAEAETPAAAPFIKSLAQVLHLRLESHATEVSARLKPYLTDTWEWLAMFAALQLGFLMTLVGYVGCFTIVQNSPTPSDTYIWLGVEVALALIRLATWAINPSCDDPDGVWFRLRAHNDAFLQDTLGTEENPAEMFKIVPERKFWEALTAHSGPVNIDNMKKIRGFQHWYSWIRRQTVQGSADILCIVLEGEPAVLCTMDVSHGQDVEFHSAEITSNDYTGHAVQRERLVEDHELMTAPSDFKTNVFEHYNFIFATMGGDSLPIQASWPLSESSVAGPLAIAFPIPGGGGQPGDPEQGTPGDSDTAWRNVRDVVKLMLSGTALTYRQFSASLKIISDHSASRDLYQKLSAHLSTHTKQIYEEAPDGDKDLASFYNERWKVYSDGTLTLDRLFRPLNSNFVKHERDKGGKEMIDTVENVALKQWNTNVLQGLSVRLKANGMAPEVDRVLAFFMSRDLTRDDLRKMCIDVVHSSEKAAELHQEQPELSPLVTLDSREDELRKAVALHRERWVTDPTAGADLASSLRDLGAHLHATGHYQGALRVNEQAVDLLRRLTETDPTFTKDVASALSAVGEDLRTAGRNEDALRADEETVDLLRTLVEMDPSVRQDLGRSLRNLALDLHATGHHNDALRANEEAGQLFLELTRTEAISIKELAGLSPLESFAENYAQVERGTEAAGVDTELETRRRTPSEEHAATEPTKERVKEDTNLPLQVYLPPDFQYVDALFPPKALESQPERQLFARTTFMDMADLALRNAENSDEFEIDNVSLKLENPVTRRLGKDMVKHLPNVIDGIAHFMYFLNRQKGSTSQGGIALEMHRLVGHFPGRRPDPTAGNITVDSNEVRFRQEPGAKYGFTIRNNSAIDLLPYLFYFDPDQYTIFCWYKPDNALPPLRSHGVVTIGMGGELAFLFQLPPGVSSSTGFLKLFVSTEHLHLESIVQKISPFDPEFQPRRLKIDQDPFLAAKDWDTLRVTLKITAK